MANLGPLVHPGSYRCEFPSQIISIATLLPPNGWSLTGVNNTLPGTCTTPQSMSLRWWKMVSEVIKHSHRQAKWLRPQGKTTARAQASSPYKPYKPRQYKLTILAHSSSLVSHSSSLVSHSSSLVSHSSTLLSFYCRTTLH